MHAGENYLEDRDLLGYAAEPFLLAKNAYAFESGHLYKAQPEKQTEIILMLDKYDQIKQQMQPSQELLDEMQYAGDWPYQPDEHLQDEANHLIGKMKKFQGEPIAIEDLTFSRADKTALERYQDIQNLQDYEYLMSKPIRETIEQEFGLKLSDLSLKEQFYFLQFVKHKEAKDISLVKEFVKEYGTDGLKTFLSLDYGQELGDKIVELGSKAESAEVKKLFSEYARIVDTAEREIRLR
jgi:hypothetical protein